MIVLGGLLLVAAAVTLLSPDKPNKPSPSDDPADSSGDPADSGTDPLEAAAL